MPNKEGKPIPADLPAGHQRNELNRRITDNLEQEREEEEELGGAIDPGKFQHIDNEIASKWEAQKKREREAGLKLLGLSPEEQMNLQVGVTNPRPGYLYKWLNHEDCYVSPQAKAVIRAALERAQKARFFPVTDAHDPEVAKEFKDSSGLRRWGDVVLWAIYLDDWKALEAHNAMLIRRSGAIEESYTNTSNNRLQGHGRAYDQSDPRFVRYIGAEKSQPFTATVVPEGEQNRR